MDNVIDNFIRDLYNSIYCIKMDITNTKLIANIIRDLNKLKAINK